MIELGNVDRGFFDAHIYPNLGTSREDGRLGPRHGVDFGAIDYPERDPFWSTFEEFAGRLAGGQ